AVDKAGVARERLVRSHAELVRDAGPPALEYHVRRVEERPRDPDVLRRRQVKDNAALAALEYRVGRVPPARAARRIDADDVRAEVGELERRQGAGDELAE